MRGCVEAGVRGGDGTLTGDIEASWKIRDKHAGAEAEAETAEAAEPAEAGEAGEPAEAGEAAEAQRHRSAW